MEQFTKEYHSLIIFLALAISSLFIEVSSVVLVLSFLYIIAEKLLAYLKQPNYSKIISEMENSLKTSIESKEVGAKKQIELLSKELKELEERFSSFKASTIVKKESVRF